MEARGEIQAHPQMLLLLRTKVGKSASGILSITVFTSPYPEYTDESGRKRKQRFSCQWNCYYCPNHKDHPRSYLPDEPGCMRSVSSPTHQLCINNSTAPLERKDVALTLSGSWQSV